MTAGVAAAIVIDRSCSSNGSSYPGSSADTSEGSNHGNHAASTSTSFVQGDSDESCEPENEGDNDKFETAADSYDTSDEDRGM